MLTMLAHGETGVVMPKRVDHGERRRRIARALLVIVGERGIEDVSLREVARQAGVSMGAVQHYFASKDAMLRYALEYWVTLAALDADGRRDPRAALDALAAGYLPHDEQSRADARVALAFVGPAGREPAIASALEREFTRFARTLSRLLATCNAALDAGGEAVRLAALLDGLRYPVLVGALSYADALAVLRRHLDQVCASTSR
jgi:AcrR family transcriptional regulator